MDQIIEKALIGFKVFLWGEIPIKKSLLSKYDIGNRNPVSLARFKKADGKKNKKSVRGDIFDNKFPYVKADLEFLNSEYDRITSLFTDCHTMTLKEETELEDLQEQVYNKIELVEKMKDEPIRDLLEPIEPVKLIKGSDKAIERALKMRQAKEAKRLEKGVVEKITMEKKARVVKGSEEAKEMSRRLVEAKRIKKENKIKEEKEALLKIQEEELKNKPWLKDLPDDKLKPWYYIGDIPKGYREATEDEAIFNKKISQFGKYTVDKNKYLLFQEHNILLTDRKNKWQICQCVKGLRRRLKNCKYALEVICNKLDNEKYADRLLEFTDKYETELKTEECLLNGIKFYEDLYHSRY